MSGIKDRMGREAFSVGFDYAYSKLEKDLKQGASDLLNLAEKYLSNGNTAIPIDEIKEAMDDSDGILFSFLERAMKSLDKNLLKSLFLNAVYEIAISGRKKIHEFEDKLGVSVPRFILMNVTNGWIADNTDSYDSLSFDDINKVVRQGQDMGIFLYFITGGEPLLVKDDILRLCKENPRSNFMCFTSGVLIDNDFCAEIKKVGNLVPIVSLEELEVAITLERGFGFWNRMLDSLTILRDNKILFGTAVCYTSLNYRDAVSGEFVAMERDRGVMFSMYSNYTPISQNDDPDLMLNPDERAYTLRRIREIRNFKSGDGMFAFDFQKDSEYLGGSISGGRTYMHIKATGDVVNSGLVGTKCGNIRSDSLIDIIKKPDSLSFLEPVDRLYKNALCDRLTSVEEV